MDVGERWIFFGISKGIYIYFFVCTQLPGNYVYYIDYPWGQKEFFWTRLLESKWGEPSNFKGLIGVRQPIFLKD